MRKAAPLDSKTQKSTWAQANITDEAWSQDEIIKQVKKLNEKKITVAEKKQQLAPNQQAQVNNILDEQINLDRGDSNFEWSLAQIDQKIKTLRNGLRETTTLTVYMKRAPIRDANAMHLFDIQQRVKVDRENRERERVAQMGRPPAPPMGQDKQENGDKPEKKDKGGDAQFIKLPPKGCAPKGRGRTDKFDKFDKDPKKKRNVRDEGSSRSSQSSSDYGSDSGDGYTTSSSKTSWTGSSGRRQKKNGRRRFHGRNREYPRFLDRPSSPDPRFRETFGGGSPPFGGFSGIPQFGGGPRPNFIPPEVPHVSAIDPVTAAYQQGINQGKINADAERFELERELERIPRIRPVVDPRAIITYGVDRYDRRPSGPRLVPVDDVRFVDEDVLRREPRSPRSPGPRIVESRFVDDDFGRRREVEIEDYIGRRRARSPRVIYRDTNPFRRRSPRRYSPSVDSYDSPLYS
jgi:hypothetical protein